MIDVAYIYTLADPRTNEVRYVGKTHDMHQRFSKHIRDKRRAHKWHWINSLLVLGLKPVMEIIEEITDQNDSTWQESERFWIETLRFYGCRLVNQESGGHSGKKPSLQTRQKLSMAGQGHSFSVETKAKISRALKGRKLSTETRKKMAISRTGLKRSPEFCAALSKRFKGVKFTAQHCANMAEVRKGVALSKEHRENISNALRGIVRSKEFCAKVSASKRAKRTILQLAFEL